MKTIKEAAEYLNMCKGAIKNACCEGRLKADKEINYKNIGVI